MPFPATLLHDLARLTQALNRDDVDLAQTVELLATDVARAAPSYLGLSIVLTRGDETFDLWARDDAHPPPGAGTSLAVTLAGAATEAVTPPVGVTLVLYAGVPGAFVDLAADLGWLQPSIGLALDHDLPAWAATSSSHSLNDLSTVNQAVGVLIGRGHTPEQAVAELDAAVDAQHPLRVDAAARILADLDDGHDFDDDLDLDDGDDPDDPDEHPDRAG